MARTNRTQRIRKPAEDIPSISSSLQVPAHSELKASVAPKQTDDADIQIVGDPLQLVNIKKHPGATSHGYRLQKVKRRSLCRQEQPVVD